MGGYPKRNMNVSSGLRQTTYRHVDDALVVADKPAGLLAVPGRGPDKADCLAARVQAEFSDALIVHRLDMDTSGLMLMARGPDAQRTLSHAFASRAVHKRYVAWVAGRMTLPELEWGTVELPLICDWPNRPRQMVCHATGKPALTHYEILERSEHSTLVLLRPHTGRSHQLRVHMASLGHPILGDNLYGEHMPGERLMLHAAQLGLFHPYSGEWTMFHAECDFAPHITPVALDPLQPSDA